MPRLPLSTKLRRSNYWSTHVHLFTHLVYVAALSANKKLFDQSLDQIEKKNGFVDDLVLIVRTE